MYGVKKILFATLFLLLREFLSVRFFINRTFAGSDQRIPSLLNSAAPIDATAAKFDSARRTHLQFVLERTGKVTSSREGFLTAKKTPECLGEALPSLHAVVRIFLLPKFLATSSNRFSISKFPLLLAARLLSE